MKCCYLKLRSNAKRRGKIFEITLEYFREFCHRTTYHIGKGRTREAFTVDCIEPEKGYMEGNIQVLSLSDNASKGILVWDDYLGRLYIKKIRPAEVDKDCPF